MASTGKKITPHPAIGKLVEWMIPDHHQEYVIGDLSSQQLRSWPYFRKALEWVCFIVSSQVRPAFHLPLFIAEAAALVAAFAGTPFDQGFFIALSAGLLGLVLRDAYVYPRKEGLFQQGVDAAAAVFFILLVEIFEVKLSPGSALSSAVLLRGLALALLTVSMVRVLFRGPRNQPSFGAASYRMTRAVTLLWMAAAMVVLLMNRFITGELLPHLDLFLFAPLVPMAIAFRGKKNSLEGTQTGGLMSWNQDHASKQLQSKVDRLWVASETPDLASHLVLEGIAVGLFALLALIGPVLWQAGYLQSGLLDRLTAGTNVVAVVALCWLWLAIRRANENLARQLKEQLSEKRQI